MQARVMPASATVRFDRSPVSLDDCMGAQPSDVMGTGHVLGCSEMPHHAYVLSNSHGHDAISELTY